MTFVCLIYLVSHFTSYLFLSLFNAAGDHFEKPGIITGSPSSKYEHRHCCITFEFMKGFQLKKKKRKKRKEKNRLPYLKCVLGLSCVIREPIYVHFMGFSVPYFGEQ